MSEASKEWAENLMSEAMARQALRGSVFIVVACRPPRVACEPIPESEGTEEFARGFLEGLRSRTPKLFWKALNASVVEVER